MFDLAASVPGVDLSKWDAPIDYDRLVASGVRWVIARAGNGHAADTTLPTHIAGIAGRLPVGTYWFGSPGRDPVAQALIWERAVALADPDGHGYTIGHWLDLEAADGKSRDAVARWVAAFLLAADSGMGRIGIYASASWWTNYVTSALVDPGPRLWWVARYPWQDRNGGPVGSRPPDDPSAWPVHVAVRAGGRDMAQAPLDAPTAIWQWCSIGNGQAVGTPRAAALDCDLMDADVFAALTATTSAPDTITLPVVTTPDPAQQEDDEMMTIARRDAAGGEQDPRLYKTNGLWKERIYGDTPEEAQAAWDHACDDLGKPRGFLVDMDAGRINRMRDVGPDPV